MVAPYRRSDFSGRRRTGVAELAPATLTYHQYCSAHSATPVLNPIFGIKMKQWPINQFHVLFSELNPLVATLGERRLLNVTRTHPPLALLDPAEESRCLVSAGESGEPRGANLSTTERAMCARALDQFEAVFGRGNVPVRERSLNI